MIGYAVLGGFVLDAVFRRPCVASASGGVHGQGHLCAGKRAACPSAQKHRRASFGDGRILAFCLPVGTFALASLVCMGAAALHPLLGLAVQMFWCGQALAAKGLVQESTNVYRELTKAPTCPPHALR